jgi:hypothetical protein
MSSEAQESPAAAAPKLQWTGVVGKPRVEVRKLDTGSEQEGLFATAAFAAGAVVLQEHAFASASVDCPATVVGLGAQIMRKLDRLEAEVAKAYREPASLGLVAPKGLVVEIGENLTAVLAESGMTDLARIKKFAAAVVPYAVRAEALLRGSIPNVNVHPICGKANHSCAPNCLAVWNANGTTQHLVAIRGITPGEELTVTYWIDLLTDARAVRQVLIRSKQGWTCRCPRCVSAVAAPDCDDCPDVFARLRRQLPDEAEFQRLIGDPVTAIEDAVEMKPGVSRNARIRTHASALLANLECLNVVDSEPSLVWHAAAWFLRSSPDATQRAGKEDIKRACELLWAASVSTRNTPDLPPVVPLLASLWIYHVLDQAHLATKNSPRALLAAFEQHRAVRRTVDLIEALPKGAQTLARQPTPTAASSTSSAVSAVEPSRSAHSGEAVRARQREKLAQRAREVSVKQSSTEAQRQQQSKDGAAPSSAPE